MKKQGNLVVRMILFALNVASWSIKHYAESFIEIPGNVKTTKIIPLSIMFADFNQSR